MEDLKHWQCPHCGADNTELPETVMAECSECGEAFDMPQPETDKDG